MLHGMSQILHHWLLKVNLFAYIWSILWQKGTEFRQKPLIKRLCLTCTISSVRFISFYIYLGSMIFKLLSISKILLLNQLQFLSHEPKDFWAKYPWWKEHLVNVYVCEYFVCVKLLSHVGLFATPWTVAYQASLSMGFSRQGYWSGLPFPFPEDIPHLQIEHYRQMLYHLSHHASQ